MRISPMHSFDTYKYIKELTKAGLKEAQAKVIIKSITESREYDSSQLASKEQVAAIEKAIDLIREDMGKFATKEQLASVEKDIGLMRQEIGTMRQEMSKFATKEQLEMMGENISRKFTAQLNVSENNMLRWILPFLLTICATMMGIAFKLFFS